MFQAQPTQGVGQAAGWTSSEGVLLMGYFSFKVTKKEARERLSFLRV
jgi:hypothetical protein